MRTSCAHVMVTPQGPRTGREVLAGVAGDGQHDQPQEGLREARVHADLWGAAERAPATRAELLRSPSCPQWSDTSRAARGHSCAPPSQPPPPHLHNRVGQELRADCYEGSDDCQRAKGGGQAEAGRSVLIVARKQVGVRLRARGATGAALSVGCEQLHCMRITSLCVRQVCMNTAVPVAVHDGCGGAGGCR
jgi:hypothetical protein